MKIIAFISAFLYCANILSQQMETHKLKVGDSYAGGIIFYLDGSGKHGNVCATKDQSKNANWQEAKLICENLVLNNYNDWYLPSKDELDIMYVALRAVMPAEPLPKDQLNSDIAFTIDRGVKGFACEYYWSSSEVDEKYVWVQYFCNNSEAKQQKNDTGFVRAIRSF